MELDGTRDSSSSVSLEMTGIYCFSISPSKIGLEMGMPVDLLQVDMTRTWEILGEITGDAAPDELITQLFSQFCLGK